MGTGPMIQGDPRIVIALSVGAALLVVVLAFSLGRCSSPEPEPILVVTSVDAGPGELVIAERLDASVQSEAVRLHELEREHADEVRSFEEAEREEYAEVRARGRDALAIWFKERSRALLRDGGQR